MPYPTRHTKDELTDSDHIKIQREVTYMKRKRRYDLQWQLRHATTFTYGNSIYIATVTDWLFGSRPAAIQLATLYESDYEKLPPNDSSFFHHLL